MVKRNAIAILAEIIKGIRISYGNVMPDVSVFQMAPECSTE